MSFISSVYLLGNPFPNCFIFELNVGFRLLRNFPEHGHMFIICFCRFTPCYSNIQKAKNSVIFQNFYKLRFIVFFITCWVDVRIRGYHRVRYRTPAKLHAERGGGGKGNEASFGFLLYK